MKVKVDGCVLFYAMTSKLERMQPRMDALNAEERKHKQYLELKRNTPWWKRFTIWRRYVESPYGGIHKWSNIFFASRYDELASALTHMKVDEVYTIDSLDFDKYGLD